jgi:WD40 repeat protein
MVPKSGHLLLSSAADGKAKLWDVYHSRELLRTFSGVRCLARGKPAKTFTVFGIPELDLSVV